MSYAADIAHDLTKVGVVAYLQDAFEQPTIVEVADALLATPMSAAIVATHTPDAADTIYTLHERAISRLLVGAHLTHPTLDTAEMAWAAGAEFVLGDAFSPQLGFAAWERDTLYIPQVRTAVEARRAYKGGCLWGYTDTLSQAAQLAAQPHFPPNMHLLTFAPDFSTGSALAWTAVTAVCIGRGLIADPAQSMTTTIRNGRHLLHMWRHITGREA